MLNYVVHLKIMLTNVTPNRFIFFKKWHAEKTAVHSNCSMFAIKENTHNNNKATEK